MLPSYYNRHTWGEPIPLDPAIIAVADETFPNPLLFSHEAIEIGWSADRDDEDFISAAEFTLILSERDARAMAQRGDGEHVPVQSIALNSIHPTIGELAFVLSRFPMAFGGLSFPDFTADELPKFTDDVQEARYIFPRYEALAWVLLSIHMSSVTSPFAHHFGSLLDSEIGFDDAARYVNAGVRDPHVLIASFVNDVDPHMIADR